MKSCTALPYSLEAKFWIADNAAALSVLSGFIDPHSLSMLA
jgi:hypothetical protein